MVPELRGMITLAWIAGAIGAVVGGIVAGLIVYYA